MAEKKKIRTIITQDAEVDDQNSLRHFLFYANEMELQGIVQTSSIFHWIGLPGAKRKERTISEHEFPGAVDEPYDKPYRWTGTDWMFRTVDDYEKDYPKLSRHAEGYPAPDELRDMIKIGNVGYPGEMEYPTEGSELIREKILDEDPRTLYLQVWGGTNTIARALLDIQKQYETDDGWPQLKETITKKIVITACGEQDPTYREYIAEEWPGIRFVKTLQMESYAYPWFIMPEGESKDCLWSEFMKQEILFTDSALAGGYCTWLDGKYYEGEGERGQFGTNEKIADSFLDGFPVDLKEGCGPKQYDFLSEGDSPTFFVFLDWGFRTLEDFTYGGLSGRYVREHGQRNSKGEDLNVWNVVKDWYTDRDGKETEEESMWQYVADIQRDFAAHAGWCDAEAEGEYRPRFRIENGVDYTVKPGERVTFRILPESRTAGRDSNIAYTWKIYKEASTACAAGLAVKAEHLSGTLDIPADAKSKDQIHVIVKAQGSGHYHLTYYQQIIISVI